jgi:BRCT domain type II-containing protein
VDYIEGAFAGEISQYAGSVYPGNIGAVSGTSFIVTTEYFTVEPDAVHHRTRSVFQGIYNPFRGMQPPFT